MASMFHAHLRAGHPTAGTTSAAAVAGEDHSRPPGQHRQHISNSLYGRDGNTETDHTGHILAAVTSAPVYVRALYDYAPADQSALRFRRNEIIEVITQLDSGWWDGRSLGRRGWFPSNFVEPVVPGIPENVYIDDEEEDVADAMAEGAEAAAAAAAAAAKEAATAVEDAGGPPDWMGTARLPSYDNSVLPDDSALTHGQLSMRTADSSGFSLGPLTPLTPVGPFAQPSAPPAPFTALAYSSPGLHDPPEHIGEIVLAADDEEISDPTTTVLRQSNVPLNAWTAQETNDGHVYYFSPRTGATAWELPPDGHVLTADEAARLVAEQSTAAMGSNTASPALRDSFGNNSARNSLIQSSTGSRTLHRQSVAVGSTVNTNVKSASTAYAPSTTQTSTAPSTYRHHDRNISRSSTITTTASVMRANSRKSTLHVSEPEVPDNELPIYWGKKRTTQGRVYYYNMITDRTTWSLRMVDLTTGEPLEDGIVSNRNSLLSNASDVSIEDAPLFTVHALARSPSNSFATSPPFIGSERADEESAHDPHKQLRWRKPSGFVGKLNGGYEQLAIHDDSSYLPSAFNDATTGGLGFGITWSRLVALIVLSIHRLNHSAKHVCKSAFIADSSLIVDAISAMLCASGTTCRDAPAVKAHKMLRAYHSHLMLALSQLVLAAKDASRIWPAPSAVLQMQRNANEVLIAARYFMSTAQSAGIEVYTAINDVDLDTLEVELSGPLAYSTAEERAREHGNEYLYADQPSASVDLLVRLGDTAVVVMRAVSAMQRHLQHLGMDLRQLPQDSQAPINKHTISHAKAVVAGAERLLKLGGNLCYCKPSGQDARSHLRRTRSQLQCAIANLIIAIQEATNPRAPISSVDLCVEQARLLDNSAKEFLIAAKLLIEECDALVHRALERNVDRFRAIQHDDGYSDASIRVRRALSMSQIGVEAELDGILGLIDNDVANTSEATIRERDRRTDSALDMAAAYEDYLASHEAHVTSGMRSMNRMLTEPTIHRGATAAAMRSVAARIRVGDVAAHMDTDLLYGEQRRLYTASELTRSPESGNIEESERQTRYPSNPAFTDLRGEARNSELPSELVGLDLATASNAKGAGYGSMTDAATAPHADIRNAYDLSTTDAAFAGGGYDDMLDDDEHDDDNEDGLDVDEDEIEIDDLLLEPADDVDISDEQPASFPIPRDMVSTVAPWTIQSPELGVPHAAAAAPSATSLLASTLAASGAGSTSTIGAASATNIATSAASERSKKLVRLLGDDIPIPGSASAAASSSKVKQLLGEDVSSAVAGAAAIPANAPAVEEKPWFLGYDYGDDEIVFTIESAVKGGTLRALVERCTLHDTLDTNFITTFLLTYRSYTTTEEFMDLLCKRYQVQPPPGLKPDELEIWRRQKQKPIRVRVVNIIKQWLEQVYTEQDAEVLVSLDRFVRDNMATQSNAQSLLMLIEKRRKKSTDYTLRKLVRNTKNEAPPPIMPKNLKRLKFLDIDPTELARQLTLIDSQLYNKITPMECLNKAWSKKDNPVAVNIKEMISISNHLTHWVVELIVQERDTRKRSQIIRHFVLIAEKSMSLNNFNSLMAILAGLNSSPIYRLKRTWEQVSAKTMATLDMLKAHMNQTKNFAIYREGLHSIDPPCVPFLGVYLTDLTFTDDGNPDKLPGTDLINFSKYSKCAEVISEIQQYQKLPYCLTTVPQIQMFLQRNLQGSRDVQDLYNMSLNIEPREREDEKIARLLHESGFL